MERKVATIGSKIEKETITANQLREIFIRAYQKTHRLTDWERNFLRSISNKFLGSASLMAEKMSEKQIETLRKIEKKLWAD
jgi:hypothetical protein